MKKNPILMKATKGGSMQENYDSDSPAKILGLYQKGKKALKGVKKIYKSITGTKKTVKKKKYTNKNPYDIERYNKKFDTKKEANLNIFGFNKKPKIKKIDYNQYLGEDNPIGVKSKRKK